MHKSTGVLHYSPKLDGNVRVSSKWWLVINCDPEIGRYYRELHTICSWGVSHWRTPAWKEHVSVIRDEEPPLPEKWEAYEGELVEFEYGPLAKIVGDFGSFLVLPVRCERVKDIRVELGLPREPFYDLHLTVGNNRNL